MLYDKKGIKERQQEVFFLGSTKCLKKSVNESGKNCTGNKVKYGTEQRILNKTSWHFADSGLHSFFSLLLWTFLDSCMSSSSESLILCLTLALFDHIC